ncbi:MAG: homoserine kinase [Alphaproteobacteria bacterium]|nr:homoserine kinase [Alphaproteobacteria bacterium]
MAVYTDVSFEDLETFLHAYDLGTAHVFKGIAEGVSNSNYYLQTDRGTFILTLYESRVEAEDLPFYLGLMEHLARAGIQCPTPVHARDGKTTRKLNDRQAAILSFLDGVSLRRPLPQHCTAAGVALAEIHAAGARFSVKRDNALGLKGWRNLVRDCAPDADTIAEKMRSAIEEELAFLETSWPAPLPSGIVHADLFPDNVLFVDNKISGIIDFYFACNDSLAYDLAVTLNAWCFEPDGAFNLTKARALIGGYETKRKLEKAERAAFPVLCRGAALRFLLTRLYDLINHNPAALVRPKDPREFVRRLRFHRTVRSPEAYGL